MSDNSIKIDVDGRPVKTLRDLLPDAGQLDVLIVGKTPAPVSVAAGHFLQGRQGQQFWRLLRYYGIFQASTEYEDDSLIENGFGITDVAKVPREYRSEPTEQEYSEGAGRILALIRTHRPRVLMFIYKRVLDKIVQITFDPAVKSTYGFNAKCERFFHGAKVFVFPMPGTPCNRETQQREMRALSAYLRATRSKRHDDDAQG